MRLLASIAVVLAAAPVPAAGQNKKKDDKKPEPPRLLVCSMPALPVGKPVKLTLRGTRLDTLTAVRVEGAPGGAGVPGGAAPAVKLAGKAKSAPPNNGPAEKWGDTEAKVEFALPKDAPAGELTLVAVGPDGESAPLRLLVGSDLPVTAEKEPNNGFRAPQTVALPGAVDGQISGGDDVDVYAVPVTAGRRVIVEIRAARHGSLLDARLTLYDRAGRQLAVCDDTSETGADPRIEFTPAADGTVLVAVADAHEAGGGLFAYRLIVRPAK
jgi:hypothetical protein